MKTIKRKLLNARHEAQKKNNISFNVFYAEVEKLAKSVRENYFTAEIRMQRNSISGTECIYYGYIANLGGGQDKDITKVLRDLKSKADLWSQSNLKDTNAL